MRLLTVEVVFPVFLIVFTITVDVLVFVTVAVVAVLTVIIILLARFCEVLSSRAVIAVERAFESVYKHLLR